MERLTQIQILKASVDGVQRMINHRNTTLSHIKKHISGETFYMPSHGSVAKSYMCNINMGLKLDREIKKLRVIKSQLRYILEMKRFNNRS
jgi:hypothetical protein